MFPRSSSRRFPAEWNLYLGIFLLVLGAKLWVIARYGNITPFWDQWGAEGVDIYEAFRKGSLSVGALFRAHVDHRIFFTRVFGLGVFLLNGNWDPIVQMVMNAVLHSAAIVLFAIVCGGNMEGGGRRLFVMFTGVVFALSFGAENTLCSFQSQFYFVSLFGILCIWLAWKHETLSPGWWLAVVAGVCGIFSLASGLCALAVALGLQVLRWWLKPQDWRRQSKGVLVFLVLSLVAYALVPKPTVTRRSLGDQIKGLEIMLGWPGNWPWGWLLLQAPFVCLAIWGLRRRLPARSAAWLILAYGAWGCIEAFVIAHGRGVELAGRYTDLFSLTLCAQFATLCWQPEEAFTAWHSRLWRVIGLTWCLFATFGMAHFLIHNTRSDIAFRADSAPGQQKAVSYYLATKKVARLDDGPLPYPDAKVLHQWLDDPDFVSILPTRIRPAIATSATESTGAFFPNAFDHAVVGPHGADDVWGSYGPNREVRTGEITLTIPPADHARWLEFYVAGNTMQTQTQNSLTLIDSVGKRHDIALPIDSGHVWHTVIVRAPAGPLTLRARSGSTDAWFAFAGPRGMGPLSRIVSGIDQDVALMIAALGVTLLIALFIKPGAPVEVIRQDAESAG